MNGAHLSHFESWISKEEKFSLSIIIMFSRIEFHFKSFVRFFLPHNTALKLHQALSSHCRGVHIIIHPAYFRNERVENRGGPRIVRLE